MGWKDIKSDILGNENGHSEFMESNMNSDRVPAIVDKSGEPVMLIPHASTILPPDISVDGYRSMTENLMLYRLKLYEIPNESEENVITETTDLEKLSAIALGNIVRCAILNAVKNERSQ